MSQPVYIRHVNEPDAKPGRTTREAWEQVWQHKTLPDSDEPAWVEVTESGADLQSLESMKVDELRAYAEENSIDLGTARTKAQILNAVKAASPEGDQP